ncbi:MAG: Uma2 family endonuclease [Planctomycetaceae bacterium]
MVMLVAEPYLEEQLIAERQAAGIDQHDEVWDGVYIVSPIADNEHQLLAFRLAVVLQQVLDQSGDGTAYPGVNVTDRKTNWRKNFRVPDVAVFLKDNPAVDRGTHWLGGPDFAVEIVSAGDRSREKLDFYAKVGVRELLLVDRAPWSLELFRLRRRKLVLVGRSTLPKPAEITSHVLPLTLKLVAGKKRPQIEVAADGGRWNKVI